MNTEAENKQQGKGAKIARSVAAVALAGCLVGSLGLNIYQAVVPNQKESEFIDYILDRIAEEEQQENEYIEDGFKVGGEYEIRSTTHISDAYKSGDDSQLSEEDKETLELAGAVLDEVIEDGMSDYEKELAVYLWMVRNIGGSSSGVIGRPGMSRSAFTPHDVLTSRNAVCVGYATTFRLLMNMLGMEVHIVHNEYHSWDLIQLDGDWYHVDVYSDAHGTLYGNFNMTDQMCNAGHSWDESALPEAKSVKYSPAVQNSVEVDDISAIPALLKASLEEREGAVFYRFKTPLTEEENSAVEFLVSELDMVFSGMLEDYYYFRAMWYPDEDGNDILGMLLEADWDDEDGEDDTRIDASSPEGKAIIQAIAEAFDLDPAVLGAGEDGGEEAVPADGFAMIGADGPTSSVVTEIVRTANGGSVAID